MPKRTTPGITPDITVPDQFGSTKKQGCAQKPNEKYIPIQTPAFISQKAINFASAKCYDNTNTVWVPAKLCQPKQAPYDVNIEHFCASVVHPAKGETITQYTKLAKDLLLREVWQT